MSLIDSADQAGDDPDGAQRGPSSPYPPYYSRRGLDLLGSISANALAAVPDIRLINHRDCTSVQRTVYAETLKQLISRALFVEKLAADGSLAKDAAQLGISPEWLNTFRAEGPKVGIYEQQQPLPSLYAAIDSYGTPTNVVASLQRMSVIKEALEIGLRRKVGAGFMVSPYYGLSFNSISYGGYLSFPKKQSEVEIERKLFFSEKERKYYRNAAYADLAFAPKKLEEFESVLNDTISQSKKRITTAEKSLRRFDEAVVGSSASASEESSSSNLDARKEQHLKQIEFAEKRISAAMAMKHDLLAAKRECNGNIYPDGRIPYLEFVTAFNRHFADRYAPDLEFTSFETSAVEAFASVGVQDWPRFVRSLLRSNIISEGEAIARYRTLEDGRVRYLNVHVDSIRDSSVLVTLRSDQEQHKLLDIHDLAQQSAIAMRDGLPPTLSPISKIRYLLNLAYGPSIILCDGMEFAPIVQVTRAMTDSSFLRHPRLPQIHAYADLCGFRPTDSNEPWADLKESLHALDYYQYALDLEN